MYFPKTTWMLFKFTECTIGCWYLNPTKSKSAKNHLHRANIPLRYKTVQKQKGIRRNPPRPLASNPAWPSLCTHHAHRGPGRKLVEISLVSDSIIQIELKSKAKVFLPPKGSAGERRGDPGENTGLLVIPSFHLSWPSVAPSSAGRWQLCGRATRRKITSSGKEGKDDRHNSFGGELFEIFTKLRDCSANGPWLGVWD